MIVNMTIRLADGLLSMRLTLDETKGLGKESRFFEITDILLSNTLLMAQFIKHVIILLLCQLFLLNLGHNKSVSVRSVSRNVFPNRDRHGMTAG
jgi:hypothetical protein